MPSWNNPNLILFHGTLDVHAAAIQKGINFQAAPPGRRTDFGRGFYTTTNQNQAKSWAYLTWQRTRGNFPNAHPAVVVFDVPRDSLAQLEDMVFIRNSRGAADFWTFVGHCRGLQPAHRRSRAGGWYDLIGGSVVASVAKKLAFPDYDQLGFHTPRAAALLDGHLRKVLIFKSGQWRTQP